MKQKAQLRAQLSAGTQVVVTDQRGWRTQGKKIIQITTEEVNTMVVNHCPLDHVCNSCKDKWHRPQSKWENHVNIIFVMPHHPLKCMIIRMDCYIAVGTIYIKFSNGVPRLQAMMPLMNVSTVTCWTEKGAFRMPSMTL